jgi:hypothetical protein
MARPSSITLEVDSKKLEVASGKIMKIFKSEVRPFSKSGCYIPLPSECKNHKAFVIVVEK